MCSLMKQVADNHVNHHQKVSSAHNQFLLLLTMSLPHVVTACLTCAPFQWLKIFIALGGDVQQLHTSITHIVTTTCTHSTFIMANISTHQYPTLPYPIQCLSEWETVLKLLKSQSSTSPEREATRSTNISPELDPEHRPNLLQPGSLLGKESPSSGHKEVPQPDKGGKELADNNSGLEKTDSLDDLFS